MGAWGTGIFDDDVAADVQAMWENATAGCESASAATAGVLNDIGSDIADDTEDGPVLRIALGALQMEAGAVDADVKSRALEAIPQNLERWQLEASPEDAAARAEVLNSLRDRLLSV